MALYEGEIAAANTELNAQMNSMANMTANPTANTTANGTANPTANGTANATANASSMKIHATLNVSKALGTVHHEIVDVNRPHEKRVIL